MLRQLASVLVSLFLVFGAAHAQDGSGASSETNGQRTSVDLLLDVIEDDAARAELIERLRGADAVPPDAPGDVIVETLSDGTAPPEDASFGRRIALVTQQAAEDVVGWGMRFWRQLTRAPEVFGGLSGGEAGVLVEALKDLALVIASTVVVFFALRWLGKSLYANMSASARDGGLARTAMLFTASAVIDAVIVILAWGAGYALAILALGEFGQIGIRQTLYLNAFLLVEMAKVAVRLVLSPSATSLRPLPIGDRAASYLSSRINLIVGVVGYGQLLVVPIINSNVSFAAGRAVSALIAVAVLGFAIWLVLRNRRSVTHWLLGDDAGPRAAAPEGTADPAPVRGRRARGALAYLARHWHWPALAYLLALFVIVMLRPGDAVFQTFLASGQVLVVGLLGFAASGFISRTMVSGVSLPARLSDRVPLLQGRLNAFVPRMLFVLRLVIFAGVVLLALNAIGLIDLRGWLVSQFGLRFTGMILSVSLVLLVSFGLWLALTSWVDYRLNPEFGSVATARERTLLTLLRNAATIALVIITLMFVLAEIGLDIAPLLASAGVLGLAIGFGAQKMVQDIITGIFIQFENAMNVGDVVTVGGVTGTVERLTIRSASLRDLHGVFHIIPFSSVDMVSNYVKDYGYFVCDMGVAYREDVEEAKQAMLDAFAELKGDPDQADGILDELEWFGVNSFGDSAVMLRARIKCVPGRQWGIGRAYNGVLKTVFDARNIEIPFPHQTVYFGETKDGQTQSVKVDMETPTAPA
ncbi:Moderate conductance mechanosensitive channel YbiO precursor [Roseovarius tolerans]|uniref:Moderate conductance mechanosensitive channel YbiO n=1 Tax=Roseovarius tolerans TaxID=74031 RepID=A0A0L6CV01_9RHOB|nr:mechanosensitive ion channel domain-containing protein [Roseovarius tolerans]KNX41333.1 Moderate conductance mechanosensitive channel YbiO precursor [Roseovarius tolerans]